MTTNDRGASKIGIIVGLGNPSSEYENTYHNAGFLALDALLEDARRNDSDASAKKSAEKFFHYWKASGLVFVQPLTFMNESGIAVREALKKFKLKPESLLVLHDESDLPIGTWKLSFGRSSAGHKGVQSIIDAIGTPLFSRVRIGIRPASEARRKKAGEFALKPITARDQKLLAEVSTEIIEKIPIGS